MDGRLNASTARRNLDLAILGTFVLLRIEKREEVEYHHAPHNQSFSSHFRLSHIHMKEKREGLSLLSFCRSGDNDHGRTFVNSVSRVEEKRKGGNCLSFTA